MSDKIQKYIGETITEDQFNELVQTMNVAVLTMSQRSSFLYFYAKSLGLDPMTRPFNIIPGQSGALIIYANRACSDQLRKLHKLNIEEKYSGPLLVGSEERKDTWVVKVRVSNPDGRFEDHIGAVGIDGLSGESLSNAVMKCATKASRRGTIAFCGLGMLDETEVSPVPGVVVDNPNLTTPPPAITKPKMLDSRPLPTAAPPAKI